MTERTITSPVLRIVNLLAAGVLVFTISANLWIYIQGTQTLRTQSSMSTGLGVSRAKTEEAVSTLFAHLDTWVENLTLSTVMGLAGLVVTGGLFFSVWRRTIMRRAIRAIEQNEELRLELEATRSSLQRFQSERSKYDSELKHAYEDMEARIEERTASLSRTCAALEKELNSRRQAEKALTYQAKELERSKDVLELHVQARTQELQKLKSRYELILNSAGEGIYGLDLQGRTTFVNPAAAKLSGWNIDDMIGKSEHEVFYGLRETPAAEEDAVRKDQDGQHLGEQVFQRADGGKFPVEYVRTPITENGRLFGAVVIFKDITERKQTDEALAKKAAELSRSNAELEQFAYVASHDMQEPLRKIQAFGDRLKAKCDAANLEDGRDYLERMLGAAARMQTLINDLLTFSRVISTSQPFVPIDLTQIAREVLSDLEVRIEQTKADIRLEDMPIVEADPTQMRQLLQNLISNALKFNKPNQPPVVRISATLRSEPFIGPEGQSDKELCDIHVQDEGIGFDEKYIEKIFAVFQRLHGRSEYEGTGVGLAVCRRIADRHGGTIAARSQPNQGATFIVTLPVKQSPKETNT